MVRAIHTKSDDDRPMLSFTPESAQEFKTQYLLAQKAGAEVFNWRGFPILVGYAKYLTEYLEMQFGKHTH